MVAGVKGRAAEVVGNGKEMMVMGLRAARRRRHRKRRESAGGKEERFNSNWKWVNL